MDLNEEDAQNTSTDMSYINEFTTGPADHGKFATYRFRRSVDDKFNTRKRINKRTT